MQNDAIAAALRAAVVQLAPTTCGTPAHHQPRCARCLCRKNAAAAIEAFHLHMAAHWQGFAPDWQAQHTQIAAAIARAAKENGHG